MRAKRPHLLFMNELLARFWIGVVKLFRFVPIAVRGRIAAAVGWVLWLAIPKLPLPWAGCCGLPSLSAGT